MLFQIILGSLPLCCCDAVVNPTDEIFSGSGGLDAQIHRAAGPGLRRECGALPGLKIGEAALTGAYGLPCRAIIHTVAPWWTGRAEELEGLRRCYRSALRLALEKDLHELAFPLIGSGTRGFPKETVLQIAAEELRAFLEAHDDFDIRLVVYDRSEFQPSRALLDGLENYRRTLREEESFAGAADYGLSMPMQKEPAEEPEPPELTAPEANRRSGLRERLSQLLRGNRENKESAPVPFSMPADELPTTSSAPEDEEPMASSMPMDEEFTAFSAPEDELPMASSMPMDEEFTTFSAPEDEELASFPMPMDEAPAPCAMPEAQAPAPFTMPEPSFSTARLVLDESFSEMVMRKIDEAGFKKDSECYVRANIDRRLFSKIRSDKHYHPKKTTALALAVALELPLGETRELLEKAGYSLSHSILFDVIVEYCILRKNYDIIEINELLFEYDQPLLGG